MLPTIPKVCIEKDRLKKMIKYRDLSKAAQRTLSSKNRLQISKHHTSTYPVANTNCATYLVIILNISFFLYCVIILKKLKRNV